MKKTVINKARQAGFTLVELLVSLVVMGGVAVGGTALYSQATSSEKALTITRDISSIRDSLKKMFIGASNYGSPTTKLLPLLVVSKNLPSTLAVPPGLFDNGCHPMVLAESCPSASVLEHSSKVLVSASSTGSGFTVALTRVKTDMCVDLLTQAAGWSSVRVVRVGFPPVRTTLPVPADLAASDCSGTISSIEFRA